MSQPRVSITNQVSLAAWVALGLAGALWISDDMDEVRLVLLGYVGVPWAVLHFGFFLFRPQWPVLWPRLHWTSAIVCLGLFGFGVIPLTNALGGDGQTVKRSVMVDRHVSVRDARIGGLGMIYRTRW